MKIRSIQVVIFLLTDTNIKPIYTFSVTCLYQKIPETVLGSSVFTITNHFTIFFKEAARF